MIREVEREERLTSIPTLHITVGKESAHCCANISIAASRNSHTLERSQVFLFLHLTQLLNNTVGNAYRMLRAQNAAFC